MLKYEQKLKEKVIAALKELFEADINEVDVVISPTKKEFDGDLTIIVFPFTRYSKKSPEDTAKVIGEALSADPDIAGFNVIKGFLNLQIADSVWLELLNAYTTEDQTKPQVDNPKTIMVEYSSPNTNKPQHLGHIRNNLLGYAVSNILNNVGHKVVKANLINDRGIHICKSMLSWQKTGNGETPESSGIKGDHLVGKYYVSFEKMYQAEIKELVAKGSSEDDAKANAPLMLEAREMLRKWEADDSEVRELWKMMNGWVYDGFESTYSRLGVSFDNYYYESDMYLTGKDLVEEGVSKGVYDRREDGSVWVDLSENKLDQKILLRSDGTSVYMTQDMGTANKKYEDTNYDTSVYVVGNEQDYHFKVLKLALQKLESPAADGIYHLSYGMVNLPSGRMKTREGTVVDADDLMSEMTATAKSHTEELGKIDGFSEEEAAKLYETIGMGALKFHMLKVDPKKDMMFDPEESIDFHGYTGPFIQYTYARIQSLKSKWGKDISACTIEDLQAVEKELILMLVRYPYHVLDAAEQMSPAVLSDYAFNLAKAFNRFYAELSVLKADEEHATFRVYLASECARTLKASMALLGIELPERM